jgi:hypothetical protein
MERFTRCDLLYLKSERADVWSARTLIVAVAVLFGWYTWGHWGDLQIDCGREMYVPFAVLRGKLLFRDISYQYGPLAPYLQALAFALLGVNLNVLYEIGMILVISSALLIFEISRKFEMVLPAAMAPSIFFLAESFHPTIFNFIFPYSYAASLGAFFGLACLDFAVRHAITGRLRWLIFASLCTSLALLTKQEFGLACFVILGFEAIGSCFSQCSWRELVSNWIVCSAGLIPAVAVYAFLIWKTSAKTIVVDNWVMTPGTYTMRTIGSRRMATEGFRFELNEWCSAAIGAAVSVLFWFAIADANAFIIRRLGLFRLRHVLLLVGANIVAALLVIKLGSPVWVELPTLIGQIVFPKGIFLIGFAFMAIAIWRTLRSRGLAGNLAEATLGIYAVIVGTRVMMEMFPTRGYAPFFNGPVFLVFVIVVTRVVASASRSLDEHGRCMLIGCMLSAEALLLLIGLFPSHKLLNTRMKTEFGTIYTEADRAFLFPQIISFMETHSRNGEDILVLPESPSLYFFSGMQSPSRWYGVQPGVLDPKQELVFIDEAKSAHVRYVLLCNRHVYEFGIAPFGIGYDQSIYKWIMANYIKIGQFGPRADLLPPNNDVRFYQPYVMEVYEKKGENGEPR